MSHPQAEQVRRDLETLRNVVGTELPFDRVDARFSIGIGLGALVPAVVGLAGVRMPVALLASASMFLVILAAAVIRGYLSTHPSKSCAVAKRREYRPGIWYALALFPMTIGYSWWASALDVPRGVAGGTVLMFLGVIVSLGSVSQPGRSAGLCVGVPGIVMGLLWPHLDYFQFWSLLWASVGCGMIASGVLMLSRLSQQDREAMSEGV